MELAASKMFILEQGGSWLHMECVTCLPDVLRVEGFSVSVLTDCSLPPAPHFQV